MDSAAVTKQGSELKKFKAARATIGRFFLKKSLKNTLILGLVLFLYMYAKSDGFIKDYPSVISRERLASSLGSNVGIEALLGIGRHVNTVSGFVVWNFLCLITAAGAIWALLFATKSFRGQEDSGSMELFLAGQTTARGAAARILKSFLCGLVFLYIFMLLAVITISRLPGAGFSLTGGMFFALSLCLGAAEFLAVGALASQLMPTRSKAATLSTLVFGVFYLIRLSADTSSAHWLLDLSPLGWVEKLRPFDGAQPIWLVPIALFVLLVSGLTIYFAGKRELGSAIFADKQTSYAHTALLRSAFSFAIRINRASSLAWIAATSVAAFLYSMLAKGAVQSLSKTAGVGHVLGKLSTGHQESTLSTKTFMGIVFIIVMMVAMFYVASALNRIREDEARGYLDNFLVRPLSRLRWLSGRLGLVATTLTILGLMISFSSWLGLASQHSDLSFSTLLAASINAMVPVVFVLSVGTLVYGLIPRLTTVLSYTTIGWSFLVYMLSSGLNLNHWLLDSSVLHQLALAPAVNPNWHTNLVIILLSLLMLFIGAYGFNQRDLVGD